MTTVDDLAEEVTAVDDLAEAVTAVDDLEEAVTAVDDAFLTEDVFVTVFSVTRPAPSRTTRVFVEISRPPLQSHITLVKIKLWLILNEDKNIILFFSFFFDKNPVF